MLATFLVQVEMIVMLDPAFNLAFVSQMKHMTYTIELVSRNGALVVGEKQAPLRKVGET
jgi:hypothetical protein